MKSTILEAENTEKPAGSPQAGWMIAAATVLGVSVDLLFRGERLGISFVIWAALCVLALGWTAARQGLLPGRAFLLPAFILPLAGFTAVRMEPLSVGLSMAAVLVLFAIWVRDFRAGGWLDMGWLEAAWSVISVPVEAVFRPWRVLGAASERLAGDSGTRRTSLAVLRGLLLAVPALFIFGGLLSAADLIFSDVMEQALAWFDWDVLQEVLGHVLLILISAVFFLGVLVTALRERPQADENSWMRKGFAPFVGMIETLMLLGAVDALFLVFVVIQFRYFFGGEANISAAGYTYAEYARQGFGELVAVAFLSLGLILLLARWSKRSEQRIWFNALAALLIGEVGVMLVSAFNRLLLYEAAYGFTRLRLYTHVAIVWLGVVLAVFLVLLLAERTTRSVLLAAGAAIGFIFSLNVINVDAHIVRQNTARYLQSGELDTSYLLELSFDAVPAMVEAVDSVAGEEQDYMLAALACKRTRIEVQREETGWPSANLSRARASGALESVAEELSNYEVLQGDSGWVVQWEGEEMYCGFYWD